jgi:hypothetical protein
MDLTFGLAIIHYLSIDINVMRISFFCRGYYASLSRHRLYLKSEGRYLKDLVRSTTQVGFVAVVVLVAVAAVIVVVVVAAVIVVVVVAAVIVVVVVAPAID